MTVYVKLLGEGTVVFRPAQAERVGNDVVKLLPFPDYDSSDEEWEFPPGSTVKCEKRMLSEGEALVAVALSDASIFGK